MNAVGNKTRQRKLWLLVALVLITKSTCAGIAEWRATDEGFVKPADAASAPSPVPAGSTMAAATTLNNTPGAGKTIPAPIPA